MKEVSVGHNHTAGVKLTVFTVPDKHYARWNLLYLINNGGSTKNVSVWWYDSSENIEIEILNTVSISAKTYLKLDGGSYITLESGDEVRIQPESGSTFSSVCNFELVSSRSTLLGQ
jgi:D-lyxose ketol-isomerase